MFQVCIIWTLTLLTVNAQLRGVFLHFNRILQNECLPELAQRSTNVQRQIFVQAMVQQHNVRRTVAIPSYEDCSKTGIKHAPSTKIVQLVSFTVSRMRIGMHESRTENLLGKRIKQLAIDIRHV